MKQICLNGNECIKKCFAIVKAKNVDNFGSFGSSWRLTSWCFGISALLTRVIFLSHFFFHRSRKLRNPLLAERATLVEIATLSELLSLSQSSSDSTKLCAQLVVSLAYQLNNKTSRNTSYSNERHNNKIKKIVPRHKNTIRISADCFKIKILTQTKGH